LTQKILLNSVSAIASKLTLFEDLQDVLSAEVWPEDEETFKDQNISPSARQVQETGQVSEILNIVVCERSKINTVSGLVQDKDKK